MQLMIGTCLDNCKCSIADNWTSYPVQHRFRSDFISVRYEQLHSPYRNLYAIFISRLCSFLCDLRGFLHNFWCIGDGGGVPSPPINTTARIHGFGPSFLVLIMSKAQTGLILRKLTEWGARYERTLDFGNEKAEDEKTID